MSEVVKLPYQCGACRCRFDDDRGTPPLKIYHPATGQWTSFILCKACEDASRAANARWLAEYMSDWTSDWVTYGLHR